MSESGQMSVPHTPEVVAPPPPLPPCNKHSNGGAGANMKGVSFMYELHKQLPPVPQETAVWLEIQ